MLYQLLTGTLPFPSEELRSSSLEEMRRKLREDDPPKPSVRVSALGGGLAEAARARGTDPETWRRQLDSDLDAIALKALEKERARRYETPSELSADLRRYLRREPVLARPAGRVYRMRRYVQRHRLGVGLVAGTAVLLVSFAVSMAVQPTGPRWSATARTARQRPPATCPTS